MSFYLLKCKDVHVKDTYLGYTRDWESCEVHHKDSTEFRDTVLYSFIRAHGGWTNWTMEFLEHGSYDKKQELLDVYQCSLNGHFDSNKPPNTYKTTTIYMIECRDPSVTETYIGHTMSFEERRDAHFLASIDGTNKLYEFIRAHGRWKNWRMRPIQVYQCLDKGEAHRLEWYWWNKFGSTLNSCIPGGQYIERDVVRFGRVKCMEKLEELECAAATNEPRTTSPYELNTIDLDV